LFKELIPAFPQIAFGAHLHTTPATWQDNVAAAYEAGCRRFDSALGGIGGCPMAGDALTGNLATENLVGFLASRGEALRLDKGAFERARALSQEVFSVAL
jgi:hydroxymethylglutaryl-CoA lyase